MEQTLTIGAVARASGLSVPNIRFYEAQGVIPAPARSEGGYRRYASGDVRRLRLARQARLLGLSLPDVKALVERAFSSECGEYAQEIVQLVASQRARIDRQIADLQALRAELDLLERDAQEIVNRVPAGQTVTDCGRCLLVDGEIGEATLCNCSPEPQIIAPAALLGAPPDLDLATGLPSDIVDALVCSPGLRPPSAPTIGEILNYVRGVQRETDSVVVAFEPGATEIVSAVVAAERRCCPTVTWDLDTTARLRLTITALPQQLDTLMEMFGAQAHA